MDTKERKELDKIIASKSYSIIATDHKAGMTFATSINTDARKVFSVITDTLVRLSKEFPTHIQHKLLTASALFFEDQASKVELGEEEGSDCEDCDRRDDCGLKDFVIEETGDELMGMIAEAIGETSGVFMSNSTPGTKQVMPSEELSDITIKLTKQIKKMYDKKTPNLRK